MKVSTAILLLSSLYIATALSDTPWTPIRQGGYDNWRRDLDTLGGQNNIGQASDSQVLGRTGGDILKPMNSWFQSTGNGAFNYSSELELLIGERNTHTSRYALNIDPQTGRKSIIWWSLLILTTRNNGPAGTNITYDKDTDTVTVITFEGIDQWALYQQGKTGNDPDVVDNEETEAVVDVNEEAEGIIEDGEDTTDSLTVETYSFSDYLHDFIGYEERDVETYTSDQELNTAVNNAISAVGSSARLNNIVLGQVRTLYTRIGDADDLWVRVNADVTSDTDSGEIVAVYWCVEGDCSGYALLRYWWWNSRISA